MGRKRHDKQPRGRVGAVSYYPHHGAWWIYCRDDGRVVRRRVAATQAAAAQVNAQLAISAPTLFSFTPITVPELRRRFLDHHEDDGHADEREHHE